MVKVSAPIQNYNKIVSGFIASISKDLLNKMDDDAVFSFKFWPRDQEVNVDVVVRLE